MSFNIEDYLNSLPLDTKAIDISYKELTFIPDLSRFIYLEYLRCSGNLLTSLPPLNKNLKILYCCNNKLTFIPQLNDNLTSLECSFNLLTILPPLNDRLHSLYCSYNQLTELPPLNDNLTLSPLLDVLALIK